MHLAGEGTELLVNDRFQRLDNKCHVEITPAVPVVDIAEGTVFINPLSAHVGDADNNRLKALVAQTLHRLINMPLTGKAGVIVKQILPIMHINDRVSLAGLIIRGGQMNQNIPLVI